MRMMMQKNVAHLKPPLMGLLVGPSGLVPLGSVLPVVAGGLGFVVGAFEVVISGVWVVIPADVVITPVDDISVVISERQDIQMNMYVVLAVKFQSILYSAWYAQVFFFWGGGGGRRIISAAVLSVLQKRQFCTFVEFPMKCSSKKTMSLLDSQTKPPY